MQDEQNLQRGTEDHDLEGVPVRRLGTRLSDGQAKPGERAEDKAVRGLGIDPEYQRNLRGEG